LSEREKSYEFVVAADLGGTNLRAAAVNDSGYIGARVKHPTPRCARHADEIVEALVTAAKECEASIEAGGGSIRALSVVVPGTVNISREIVLQAPNVPCLDGFRLGDALENEVGWPVLLENDANAASLGELWLGAAKGFSTFACITLGTGVGGGIVLDGKLWRGADGSGGEIGHTSVDPFGKVKCKCGNVGCLEVFGSATAIVRMANEALANGEHSILQADQLTAEKVYEAGMRGDQLALEVFRKMGTYLGVGMANLVNLLNPELIVVGGGVANGWQLFEKHMHQEIAWRAFPLPAQKLKVALAKCGDDAGLLGAAYLALCQKNRELGKKES
jgi:glucokinase